MAEKGLWGVDQLGILLVAKGSPKKLQHATVGIELLYKVRYVAKKALPSEAVSPHREPLFGANAHICIQAFDGGLLAGSVFLGLFVHVSLGVVVLGSRLVYKLL